MARIRYYYDTETCKYERVRTKKIDIVLNALGILALTVVVSIAMIFLWTAYFPSPKEVILQNQIKEQAYIIDVLRSEVEQVGETMAAIENRDDNIYRVVLGAEPIDKAIRNAGAGGADRYAHIQEKDLSLKDEIIDLYSRVDRLKRKMYIEARSQDELVELARNKEALFSAIPAIQPVSNELLVGLASGYGFRFHPIYKVKKMHYGIDFAAPIGTPIYATADGVVDKVEVKFTGYGKMLEIDHGFGYRTRYAHMHDFAVRKGQRVKRGELIGYVGDTGTSTASHLHYEVMVNDKHVNPVHYFFNDLTPAEYEKIVELASIENQSLGM
ncbi:MAG: M23 family metallopeptidase [Cyclobacteriaceae bacterium]|jgi:murein DD-endopeptidase MepM/ murein hydrolase activator NlpD|nr:M23 family metallopeptidase [Cyclobacteriaceae bacterium]